MNIHCSAVRLLLGAVIAVAASDALSASVSTLPGGIIQLHLNGALRPDLRQDLLALDVLETAGAVALNVRVLNYRIPPGGSQPVFYYTDGSASVELKSQLKVTIDAESFECPVTQLDASFPASQPPELKIHCALERLSPRRSGQPRALPLAGFSASVTATGSATRVIANGMLEPGWGALRVNDMTTIADAGSLSGTYRLDQVEHSFDLMKGLRTAYRGTRVGH